MDAFEQYLSSESKRPSVDADTLRLLGRKAAVEFTERKVPLDQSVAKLSKEAGLNDEQTRRVVEFANNTAFSLLFKAGFNQNVSFPLADASKILKSEVPVGQTKHASVEPHKGWYVPGQERASLDSLFGAGLQKVASAEVDRYALTRQWQDKTAEIRNLRSDAEMLADRFILQLDQLDRLVKEAHSEGHAPYVIGACIAEATPGPQVHRLLARRYDGLADLAGLSKVAEEQAAVVPNPITDTVAKLQELQQQLAGTQETIQQAQQMVDQMVQTMQTPAEQNPTDQLFQASAPPPQAPPAPAAPPVEQPGQPEATTQPAVM